MRIHFCLIFSISGIVCLHAQTVETITTHPKIVDGIHVDAKGNVFTTPGGLMQGTSIGRYLPSGKFDADYQSGFSGPIDIDQNRNGILYITNYDNNSLMSFNPSTKEISTILSGLDGPAGLAIDKSGNIFVTCFGAPPAYAGKKIIKVKPDGSSETWLESNDFFRPQGICFDDEGNLWVSNTPSGKIFKIDMKTKNPKLMLDFKNKIGNMVFRKKDRHFYFASQSKNSIYRLSKTGIIELIAGTETSGYVDGDAKQAQFNRPLGLGFTIDEDTLYVSEAGKLRRIIGLNALQ